jgi:hypothetical protein
MEKTRIVRMNSQVKGPGMLEKIDAGDMEAVIEMQKLVQDNCFSTGNLQLIFGVATKCALDRKEEAEMEVPKRRAALEKARAETHMLACLCAWKMTVHSPEYLETLHKSFVFAMENPHKVDVQDIRDLSLGESVLIGQRIVKNGKLIQILDAVAEGLAKTSEGERGRKELEGVGRIVCDRVPEDIKRTYEYVFEQAKMPKGKKSVTVNLFLDLMLNRENEKTNPNITVIRRIEKVLGKTKEECGAEKRVLSDGDANLPKDRIGKAQPKPRRTLLQMARDILPFKAKKERKLAYAARRN